MRGPLCGCKANNNEEYRKVIEKRMKFIALLFVIGTMTLIVGLLAKYVWTVKIEDKILGFYTGVGSGLAFLSIILWIKNKVILADEEKLKKSRLMNTDERINEINNKAFKVASIALLVSLYAIGLIGGIFNPILAEVLFILVCVFLLTYVIAYKMYGKTM
ncbi:MAG: hypothetical protein PHX70_01660 [Clostridium sp.]|nr:hypothetical protein [Clostridium sp.]